VKYRDLIGALYTLGGRGPEYDCASLAIELQRRQGFAMEIPPSPNAESAQLRTMRVILRGAWREIQNPLRGCLVFFPTEAHVGTMLDGFRFLHTTSEVGHAHIDTLESPLWRTKRRAFYVPA
jgi:cell wall-associated NlpC family hydrolase